MIGYLLGKLVLKKPPQLLVEVQGIGYEVEVPLSTFGALPGTGSELKLLTHLVVREDAHVLYGFATDDERQLFRSLIRISGVGARLALAILSGTSVDGFITCVEEGDVDSLTRLPGIGKKTAQRLIVEMRDRLPKLGLDAAIAGGLPGAVTGTDAEREAHDALLALGYKGPEASRMLRAVETEGLDTAEIIRLALRAPAKGKRV